MSHTSVVSDAMVRAYRATAFHVRGDTPFVLKLDQPSPELAELYRRKGVASAAFLTAWNPRSERCSPQDNKVAQDRLNALLKQRGLDVLPGIGRDPAGEWEGEESCLALGISRDDAQRLGREFEQNAIVWAGPQAIPELILLR